MSISIYKPKNKIIDKELIFKCYRKAKDSISFCYSEGGKLIIENKFKDFESFLEVYKGLEKDRNILIEFSTKEKDQIKKFAGPFKLKINNTDCAISLTGTVWSCEKDIPHITMSQSANFVYKILKDMPITFDTVKSASFRWVIERGLPYSVSIVIMNGETGETVIFNKARGSEWGQDGCWFSEVPYFPPNISQQKETVKNYTPIYNDSRGAILIKCDGEKCEASTMSPVKWQGKNFCKMCAAKITEAIVKIFPGHTCEPSIPKSEVRIKLNSKDDFYKLPNIFEGKMEVASLVDPSTLF